MLAPIQGFGSGNAALCLGAALGPQALLQLLLLLEFDGINAVRL
jgi:hypothetical protein